MNIHYTIKTKHSTYPELTLDIMIFTSRDFHTHKMDHTVIMFNGEEEIERIVYTY